MMYGSKYLAIVIFILALVLIVVPITALDSLTAQERC
jgi:hypothetical protein